MFTCTSTVPSGAQVETWGSCLDSNYVRQDCGDARAPVFGGLSRRLHRTATRSGRGHVPGFRGELHGWSPAVLPSLPLRDTPDTVPRRGVTWLCLWGLQWEGMRRE